MNIQEALLTGKNFRLPHWPKGEHINQYCMWNSGDNADYGDALFDPEELLSTNWEVLRSTVQKWRYVMRAKEMLPNGQDLYVSDWAYSDAYVQENGLGMQFVQKIAGTCVEAEEE